MYVFAHPSTTGCLKPFRKLGYEVLLKETPVNVTNIEGEFLREKVVMTGCCGEKEFLKLYAYTLTEHPAVVHLDLDSLVVQPLDDLFDAMLGEGDGGASVPVMFGKPLPEKIEAFFTRDYNMVVNLFASMLDLSSKYSCMVLSHNFLLLNERRPAFERIQGKRMLGYKVASLVNILYI